MPSAYLCPLSPVRPSRPDLASVSFPITAIPPCGTTRDHPIVDAIKLPGTESQAIQSRPGVAGLTHDSLLLNLWPNCVFAFAVVLSVPLLLTLTFF